MLKTIGLWLLLLPLGALAQNILVSEDMPMKNDASYELIGELKGNILLYHNRSMEHEIQCFDQRMQLSWSKELDLERRTARTMGLISDQEDDFTLFYHYRRKGNTLVKAHKYDAGANLLDSTLVFDYGFLFFTPRFELVQSEDRSKALIFFIEKQSIMRAVSFDVDSMQLLWETSFSPEDYSYNEDDLQLLVDNTGNMHLIIEKDNFRSRRKDHFYEIHSYYGSGDYRTFDIDMQQHLTFDVYFEYDNLNQRLIAAGFYSEKDLSRANGFFYVNIDPRSPEDAATGFHKFDTETLSGLLGKRGRRAKGLPEISVQEVVLRRDGGALLIGERNRMFERGGSSRTYYDGINRFMVDYYFDDLLVASIHPDGDLHWTTILHKKQYSQDDNGIYSSYFLFKTPSSLRFLFNDEIRYENTVSEYILTGRGNYDRNSLLSTENLDLRLRFRDALQTASNTLIVPSERRNRLKLVKMEF